MLYNNITATCGAQARRPLSKTLEINRRAAVTPTGCNLDTPALGSLND